MTEKGSGNDGKGERTSQRNCLGLSPSPCEALAAIPTSVIPAKAGIHLSGVGDGFPL